MNLIQDPWIPITRQDGTQERIAPWQIAETSNPVVEIKAPRPDFQGALYQFLIGLLQTACAPDDSDKWLDLWRNPDSGALKQKFESLNSTFELVNEGGPAFLQDFDMSDGEAKGIAALLIEAPGEKTGKDNLDHFVQGGKVIGGCAACTATALFALQTNAPAGGSGHRVGLRGGGPLTTLLLTQGNAASLWHKLWLNVMDRAAFSSTSSEPLSDIFPWLAPTRFSDKKGRATLPEDVNPLQMYWGMPRRIRLERSGISGSCDLCGDHCDDLFTHYRARTYGVDYQGPWLHPLTPYRLDPKQKEPPLSLKGQQGGLGYRHWLGMALQDPFNNDVSAKVVSNFYAEKSELLDWEEEGQNAVRLWCFGYDLDKMKARCWYEAQMPVLHIESERREDLIAHVSTLINAARDVLKELRSQVKAAWFSRPKDVKGDTSMIDKSFWQATEAAFYQQLYSLSHNPESIRHMPTDVAATWLSVLRRSSENLFDHWVLEGEAEDMDMKRITKARRLLRSNTNRIKSIKELVQIASADSEVA